MFSFLLFFLTQEGPSLELHGSACGMTSYTTKKKTEPDKRVLCGQRTGRKSPLAFSLFSHHFALNAAPVAWNCITEWAEQRTEEPGTGALGAREDEGSPGEARTGEGKALSLVYKPAQGLASDKSCACMQLTQGSRATSLRPALAVNPLLQNMWSVPPSKI